MLACLLALPEIGQLEAEAPGPAKRPCWQPGRPIGSGRIGLSRLSLTFEVSQVLKEAQHFFPAGGTNKGRGGIPRLDFENA